MQTKLKSKIIGREAMTKVLKDKPLQEAKVAESEKVFKEKPVIPDLKSHMNMRKR